MAKQKRIRRSPEQLIEATKQKIEALKQQAEWAKVAGHPAVKALRQARSRMRFVVASKDAPFDGVIGELRAITSRLCEIVAERFGERGAYGVRG